METGPEREPSESADPGGPVVVACLGHRCAGLHARQVEHPSGGLLAQLRDAVRTSHSGLLITTGCMGPCHEGAVVGMGHRAPRARRERLVVQDLVLLGGMQRPGRAEALVAWFERGRPARCPLPRAVLGEAGLDRRAENVTPDRGHEGARDAR